MGNDRRASSAFGIAGVAALAVLAACNGTTSYLDATGTAGREEGVLGWWLTAVASLVVLLVCLAILGGIARHRGEHNAPTARAEGAEHAAREGETPPGAEGGAEAGRRGVKSGLRWIYVGVAATVVVLLLTFGGTMVTLEAASHPPRAPTLTMDVVAHQWWWEVRYGEVGHPEFAFTTANEVHLPVGQPVRVRLQSADVIHSFWLPQIAGKTDVVPGQVNEMWLEARKAGESRGMCGEYCGLNHATMALAVTAEAPEAFARWAAARRAGAAAPTTEEARAGQTLFTRTCGACHAVEGTLAQGRVGPDLTHLASRPTIGAGALENTPQNLARWIHDAPAVKEGARMPAIPLDDADLQLIVAYLRTLH